MKKIKSLLFLHHLNHIDYAWYIWLPPSNIHDGFKDGSRGRWHQQRWKQQRRRRRRSMRRQLSKPAARSKTFRRWSKRKAAWGMEAALRMSPWHRPGFSQMTVGMNCPGCKKTIDLWSLYDRFRSITVKKITSVFFSISNLFLELKHSIIFIGASKYRKSYKGTAVSYTEIDNVP